MLKARCGHTTRTTRFELRRQANLMISSRRENQAERSHQRPPRYLTSIKLRTAHHVGIQGRGVVSLIIKQIVGLRSRQKNCWRWSDRRVVPDRFWQTHKIVVTSSLETTEYTHRVKYYASLDIWFVRYQKYLK